MITVIEGIGENQKISHREGQEELLKELVNNFKEMTGDQIETLKELVDRTPKKKKTTLQQNEENKQRYSSMFTEETREEKAKRRQAKAKETGNLYDGIFD